MGYSISWIATKGSAPDDVLAKLGLSRTGEFAEYGENPMSGATLPSGWFLLVAQGCDHAILRAEVLAGLAQDGCHVIACSLEERVMYSSAEEWREGSRIWRVEHNAQSGRLHLKSEGIPPLDFDSVRRAYAERQRAEGGEKASVDYYFEIPLWTAKNIVGFKHDEKPPDLEPESFETMTGRLAEAVGHRVGTGSVSNTPWWRFRK